MPDSLVNLVIAAPGQGAPAVFLVHAGDGWALPQVSVPLPQGVTFGAAAITAAVRAFTGLETHLLLCLAPLPAPDGVSTEAVVQLVVVLPASQPASPLQAVTLAEARRAAWVRPEHLAYLDGLDAPLPPERVPWRAPALWTLRRLGLICS